MSKTMTPVNLLHVEDDEIQREYLAPKLAEMPEFTFVINWAESEDHAIESVSAGGAQIVVMDYNLTQGNGLSCLRKLRRIDPLLPIIAISGVATSKVAAELINAGADGFISKGSFRVEEFHGLVRDSLQRAKAMRQRLVFNNPTANLSRELPRFCKIFVEAVGPHFVRRLDELAEAAREAKLSAKDIEEMFANVAADLEHTRWSGEPDRELTLLPLKLEFLRRLNPSS